MKQILFTLFFWLYFAPSALAASFNVVDYGDTTMSITNFESALAAASSGDTILFDGNDATWTAEATVGKAVIITGGGTTLTENGTLTNGFFNITNFTDNTNTMQITGFIFQGNDQGTAKAINVDSSNMALTYLRIDNNDFHFFAKCISVGGSYGVIDNNTFYNARTAIEFTAGTNAQALSSWASMAAGTANALFIEDNDFILNADYPGEITQQQISAYNGGKIVIRHNTLDTDDIAYQGGTAAMIMLHGSANAGGTPTYGYWESGDGARRSPSVIEIYENTMHGYRLDFLCQLRGGACLVWNNSITSVIGTPRIYLREEEYTVLSGWDPLRTAWPAEDQIHNSFFWGNTIQGVAADVDDVVVLPSNDDCTGSGTPFTNCTGVGIGTYDLDEEDAFIKVNRDFFMHEPSTIGDGETLGIETFTSANGAAGTHPTDGDPYANEGTMTFTADVENAYYGYVAYEYKHPLQGVGQSASDKSISGVGPTGGGGSITGGGTGTITGE